MNVEFTQFPSTDLIIIHRKLFVYSENSSGISNQSMMMNHIVPAICAKWPAGDYDNDLLKIRMQHNGAPGHFDELKDEP